MEEKNNNEVKQTVNSKEIKKINFKEIFRNRTVVSCIIVGLVCFALGFGTSRLTMRGRYKGMMGRPGYGNNFNRNGRGNNFNNRNGNQQNNNQGNTNQNSNSKSNQ